MGAFFYACSKYVIIPLFYGYLMLVVMSKRRNIFLVGPMGAGKTTIGRLLSEILHLQFLDSDQEIINRTGADISWIFDVEGENGFRKRESDVINDLSRREGIVLATGGGAVKTDINRVYLRERGTVVYLKTSVSKQYERTRFDHKRPLLKQPDPRQVLEKLLLEREPLYLEIADIVVSTDENDPRSLAPRIAEEFRRFSSNPSSVRK